MKMNVAMKVKLTTNKMMRKLLLTSKKSRNRSRQKWLYVKPI
uniref:Uncharacterized protein n=1 Tax=Medicago truncatula TaxID=3880 RepID=I3SRY5_MEDTR|nr:unknown [Medicago truncatula]